MFQSGGGIEPTNERTWKVMFLAYLEQGGLVRVENSRFSNQASLEEICLHNTLKILQLTFYQ